MAKEVDRQAKPTTKQAAQRARKIQDRAIRRVAGSDMRLSGAGGRATRKRGGAKVGARAVPSRRFENAHAVLASGPLHLVERDTDGHLVTPLGTKGRSVSGRRVARKGQGSLLLGTFTFSGTRQQVLNISGIGYRKWARHGGTRGQAPWAKGRQQAEKDVDRYIRGSMGDAIRKAFQR